MILFQISRGHAGFMVEWAVGDTRRSGVSNSHVVRLAVTEMENEVGVGMFWVEFTGLGEKLMGLGRERGRPE